MQHTSCSLVIQENADPDVVLDLRDFFERLVPEESRHYRHTLEGPDDMTSHIRASITQTSLTVPVIKGHLALGTWQGCICLSTASRRISEASWSRLWANDFAVCALSQTDRLLASVLPLCPRV